MARGNTSKIVDEIIRLGAFGTTLTAALIAPNIVRTLDAPLQKLFSALDDREQQREVQRVIRYMKQKGLLAGSYEHGMQLSEKARQRLAKMELENIHIRPQEIWDKRWRIILYDIPEHKKSARDALSSRLLQYGCFQLQKSTWITPFPCRDGIETLSSHYKIDQYITYFEALNLDNEHVLLARFKKKYPNTNF